MKVLGADRDRLVQMLRESIALMCKSSLDYATELSVDGLLGITLDNSDTFLVKINEVVKTAKPQAIKRKLSHSDESRMSAKAPSKEISAAAGKRTRSLSEKVAVPQNLQCDKSAPVACDAKSVLLNTPMTYEPVLVKETRDDLDNFDGITIKKEEDDDEIQFLAGDGNNRVDNQINEEEPTGDDSDPQGSGDKWVYLAYQQDAEGFATAKWTTAKQARGPHKCDLCGQTFRSESGLKRHKNCHTDNFKCVICEKRFGDSWDLRRHMSSMHKADKFSWYKCNTCASLFSSLNELKQHLLFCEK